MTALAGQSRAQGQPAAVGDHLAEVVVDHFLDVRSHRFGTPECEVAGQHAPYPMVLGVVSPREDHGYVVVGIRQHVELRNGLRGQARIDQRRSDVLVTAHHPDRMAVEHRPL
jgi:hypothetical protein